MCYKQIPGSEEGSNQGVPASACISRHISLFQPGKRAKNSKLCPIWPLSKKHEIAQREKSSRISRFLLFSGLQCRNWRICSWSGKNSRGSQTFVMGNIVTKIAFWFEKKNCIANRREKLSKSKRSNIHLL